MSSIIDDLKQQYKFGGITQRLIYWNIACFIVSYVIFGLLQIDFLSFVSLSSNPADLLWKPWSILSYSFFHSDFIHIFFNLIVLHFSGQLFLTFFTQKQLLGLYLLSALFSGAVFVVAFYLMEVVSPIVGASGAIMAILVATTVYQPLMNLRLMLIGNVKLWHVTVVVLLIDVMQLRLENSGGHIAHLAGAFFGFVFIKFLQNGTDLSKIVSNLFDFFVNLFTKTESKPFKKVHRNYQKPVSKPASRIVSKDKTQQQIDEILDKISKSGYDCLTKEEKEFLFKAGK
ncbi:rhomboid family intramembrane serine protease [Flavobacterium alvei]|uniref:Rhomboid family intramembrane serine protease n=1 Tax=Flavobacterium alvei TaxID=2080416 RepID=A0A2S5AFL6_9FLAO|nr:rhomboid family intramembrane serine protease [Flavobacterium alvei]POY40997.1 rhomboid family intramembrane serine protease [Flavobacterium alvei]HQE33525.1 rhomboid family intramembrane serine protease [Flavobacterium alvei]HQF47518.1 rhomboid family intramembrane serine protease [Flavobacterium alvei]